MFENKEYINELYFLLKDTVQNNVFQKRQL